MAPHVELASLEQAHLVHRTMRAAYAEYDDVLHPHSGARDESIDDVAAAMAKGGAVLAWDGDEPVGSARFEWRSDHVYVGRVAVVPTHRRRGIGAAIMARVEELARRRGAAEIRLGARTSLPANVSFYRGLDYEIVRIEPHERGGAFVAWMRKTLV